MKRQRLRIVIPAYPTFNIYSHIAGRTTALGPVCVASAVNDMNGWDAEVIDENNLGRFGPRSDVGGADHSAIQLQRPADVVGFYGGLTSTIPRLFDVAQYYQQRGIVTIAGGQHFVGDNVAEALSSGIDYIVFGEAEQTIRELLPALQGRADIHSIRGIAYRMHGKVIYTAPREPLCNFDELPYPDFSLVRYARIKLYPVERTRGCGMHCEFCTVKGRPRCASAERLIENISRLVEIHQASHFFVVDDLFGQDRQETLRFCRLLSEYQQRIGKRLSLTVQIRLDKARDPELLAAMRKAEVRHVAIGFESPIDEELKAMNKHICATDMLALVRVYRRFGFWVHGMFIFGYPAAGKGTFRMPADQRARAFKRFIRKAQIDTVQILLPVPLPGTALRERLERQGRVYPTQDVGWEYYDGNFPLFEPDDPLTAEEMHRAAKRVMGRVYRFRYMFLVAASVLSFPALIFSLGNLRAGWGRWYHRWASRLIRFGGWITIRKWTAAFHKGDFHRKLHTARGRLILARQQK